MADQKEIFSFKSSCEDVRNIKDILVVLSPDSGKSRLVGKKIDSPVFVESHEVIVELKVSVLA